MVLKRSRLSRSSLVYVWLQLLPGDKCHFSEIQCCCSSFNWHLFVFKSLFSALCLCRTGSAVRKASMCLWKSWGPLRGSCPCRCLSIMRSCTRNKSDARWEKMWKFKHFYKQTSCFFGFKHPETYPSVAHLISLRGQTDKQTDQREDKNKAVDLDDIPV